MRAGNPFVLGQPLRPITFVGYRDTLQSTLARLGSPLRGSTSVVGAHFTGRTSFLRYLVSDLAYQRHPELYSYIRIYVELFEDATYDPQKFWLEIVEIACTVCQDDKQLCAQLGKLADKWQTKAPSMYELRTLNDDVARAGKALLLALDNFEVLMANPNFMPPRETQFFERLRNLCQREPHGIALVMTTPRPLLDLWRHEHGSWFMGLYATYQVGRLTDAEFDLLLDSLLADTGVQFSPACRAELGHWSGNLPAYVQCLGQLLYDAVADGLDDQAALARVKAKLHEKGSIHVQLTRTLLRNLRDDELVVLAKRIKQPATLSPDDEELLRGLFEFGAIPPLSLIKPVAEALVQEAEYSVRPGGSIPADLQLTGRQIRELQDALLHAYDLQKLREMVKVQLDRDLDVIVSGDNLSAVTFNLVDWAQKYGKLKNLIDGALAENADNPDLKKLAQSLL